MKSRKPTASFAPYEVKQFILPLTLASIMTLAVVITDDLINSPAHDFPLILFCGAAIVYTVINSVLVARSSNYDSSYGWINSILGGIGLGLLYYYLPESIEEASHILVIFGVVVVGTVSGRKQAYLTLILSLLISLPATYKSLTTPSGILEYFIPFFVAVIASEAFFKIKNATQQHIHRLETINKINRQMMLTLDPRQIINLLDTAMQEALEADTYFIGLVKNNEIQLDLFYDDGEYFNGLCAPLDGTLAGWIIRNQKELFLPDLREDVQLEGVKRFVIGKEKTSLSWMGVPMKAANVNGVIALASYDPNAFDQADMELLSNLVQHITLALDNSIRHAQVEEQARLDSMTGVYNHGYFLKRLAEQANECLLAKTPLGLIMLDIDYFKRYNDTFGHLIGDRILNSLCAIIKSHIKQIDAVGRWGGEEFVISLLGATGEQTMQVAQRISETMATLRVEDREQRTVPIPTVSQGIAVFPDEADEIYRLIDLADRRLYVAKERGRNQIEPSLSHWQKN